MQEDIVLVREIAQGSHAAMEVLVNRYYKGIFSYIYRITGEYHTSYDLTQEVFMKMLKAIGEGRFDGNGDGFRSWIFRIAVNATRDYFRSRGYRDYQDAVEVDDRLCDEGSNVVELVTRLADSERIRNALMQLDQPKREVIILRFYHDMKLKDIARLLDTNESTVKSRLRAGLDMLRTILKKDGGDGDGELEKGIGI